MLYVNHKINYIVAKFLAHINIRFGFIIHKPFFISGKNPLQDLNFYYGEGLPMPTRAQLALIHIAKKELHLTEEIYRDILYCLFQKESAKDLAPDEVARLVNHFKWLGWRPVPGGAGRQSNKPVSAKPAPSVSANSLASPAQQSKIVAMWMTGREIHQKTMESLRHFLNNRFHVPDLRHIKARQVTAVITAIRRMSLPHNAGQN